MSDCCNPIQFIENGLIDFTNLTPTEIQQLKDVLNPIFTVNAGTTADANDDALGSETINIDDILHFWSPDGSINFSVAPGSAIVAATLNPAALDGGSFAQDNTGGNIPATLVDPTVVGSPIGGDYVKQIYDDGIVVSVFDGTNWINTEVRFDTDTFGGVVTLTAAGPLTTTNGVDVAAGEQYIEFPNGTTWASEAINQVNSWGLATGDYNLFTFPPAQPVNPPTGAKDGDTYLERYDNGYAYFTHNGTDWTLNLFQSSDDRRFTHRDESALTYVEGSLAGPQNPPANPSGGDVHMEYYENALVFFNYQEAGVAAGWDGNNVTFVPLGGEVKQVGLTGCYEEPFGPTLIDHSTLNVTANNTPVESVLCDHITTFEVLAGANQFSSGAGAIARLKPANTGAVDSWIRFNKPTDLVITLNSISSPEAITFVETDLQPNDGTAPWDSQSGNIITNQRTAQNNNGTSTVTFLGIQDLRMIWSGENTNNALSGSIALTVTSTHDTSVRKFRNDLTGDCKLMASRVCDECDEFEVTQTEVDTWTKVSCLSEEDEARVTEISTEIVNNTASNGVQSVTGEHVDNTDALNPIVLTWVKEECYEEVGTPVPAIAASEYDNSAQNGTNGLPHQAWVGVEYRVDLSDFTAPLVADATNEWYLDRVVLTRTGSPFNASNNFNLQITGADGAVKGTSTGGALNNAGPTTFTFAAADQIKPEPTDVWGFVGTGNQQGQLQYGPDVDGRWTLSNDDATLDGGGNGFPPDFIPADQSLPMEFFFEQVPLTMHTVRTYDDGSLFEVDKTGNVVTSLASIPATWGLSHCFTAEQEARITEISNESLQNAPKTIDIECSEVSELVNIITDNTADAQTGTYQYDLGIYVSGLTANVGVVQITMVNNTGSVITGETLEFYDETLQNQLGVTSDPFDIPVGTNLVTILFSAPLAFAAPEEYDGRFSTINPGANLEIAHNGQNNSPILTQEIGDESPVALLAESINNETYRIVTCSDGTQTAYDSLDNEVPLATAQAGAPCQIDSAQIENAVTSIIQAQPKVVADFVEIRDGDFPVTVQMPDDYTLQRAYDVTITNSDGSTATFTRNAGTHADQNAQAVDWATAFDNNVNGAWTATGTEISSNFSSGDVYPVSVDVVAVGNLSFNSGAVTEVIVDEQWTSANGDLTATVTLGTVDPLNEASGGNGILAGASNAGSPDTISLASSAVGWVAPDRLQLRVNDLDPGPGEFVEFNIVPDSVEQVSPAGGPDFTLTGARIDPTVNNVDIVASFNGVASITAQQRTFQGGSNRIGYRDLSAEWDYVASVSVGQIPVVKLIRCDDDFTDLAGTPVAAPAEFVACGTYAALDSLEADIQAQVATLVQDAVDAAVGTDITQRGIVTMTNNIETITFPVAFADDQYSFVATARNNLAVHVTQINITKTAATTQISAYDENGVNVLSDVEWIAVGTKA